MKFGKDDVGVYRVLNEDTIIGPNGEITSRGILTAWTLPQLATWNIYPLTEDTVPAGMQEASRSFTKANGVINITKVLQPIAGAVQHAIGRGGVVTDTAFMLPQSLTVPMDVFPSNLAVGQIYDPKDVKFDQMDKHLVSIIFQMLNDIRVLKSLAPVTAAQFKTAIKGLMP